METFLKIVIVVGFLTGASLSCQQAPNDGNENGTVISPSRSDLSLFDIMRGLEEDLADVSHGIWTQDPETVKAGAIRIAEHPKVSPEQLSVIKEALGSDIGRFVQFDKVVHDTALELAIAVDSARAIPEQFEIYHRLETGCVSCHAAFQTRVSDVLAEARAGS